MNQVVAILGYFVERLEVVWMHPRCELLHGLRNGDQGRVSKLVPHALIPGYHYVKINEEMTPLLSSASTCVKENQPYRLLLPFPRRLSCKTNLPICTNIIDPILQNCGVLQHPGLVELRLGLFS